MLDGLERRRTHHVVHRFGNLRNVVDFAEGKGLTSEEVREVLDFVGADLPDSLLKDPFQRKRQLRPPCEYGGPTRYSDGSWPVFYAALDRVTAEVEVSYGYLRAALGERLSQRTVYYSVFMVTFAGECIDLISKQDEWLELIDDDYRFCQMLGKEAVATHLDAFLAPSARHAGGSTVPVFVQRSLSDPVIYETVRFTYEAGSGSIASETISAP